ncbi:hypothetical protein BCR43DRAFT_482602 [Syncephalastrum racemosum]|uniref:Uncharacterized protein n=1 Tax=Syncephalastrum racemosum TaxID=13706 RepID=A0A1X2HTX4_SYNRA|nr:hypothetical protein BCR43DRAFT_482602 [Syncephalastrum racemosum]
MIFFIDGVCLERRRETFFFSLVCSAVMSNSASHDQQREQQYHGNIKQHDVEPTPIEFRGLLFGAAGAFGAGLIGAIMYTKRKTAREQKQLEIALKAAAENKSSAPLHPLAPSPPPYEPPKMTPAEFAKSKRDATFFAVKTLSYGTLLAFGGAGLLALTVGWYLDVKSFKEFSDKLQIIIPQKTSRLRKMLGGSEFIMKEEEQMELDKTFESEEEH